MSARRVVLVLVLAAACRREGSVTPAAPVMPDVPVAVRPISGAAVDSRTPTFVVANARGFDTGQATYEFQVLDGAALAVLEDIRDVPAGAGQTEATAPIPLVRGAGYQRKAIAHAGARQAESKATPFEVAVPCVPGDPYAKTVVDLFLTECTQRTNRRALLDPRSVLGPPDAQGTSDATYSGILSLGQDGYVTVDMGVCIMDEQGPDLRVFQYIGNEAVGVDVSGSPDGPWVDLGVKPCGDGGLPVSSNHCDFDLAGSGLKTARYVRVSDGENFPCEKAGTRSEGADIDAVQALHIK